MNDSRTGKRKVFSLPSPRKDVKLGKIPEKDSITKLKQTDNATVNISRNYTTLLEQVSDQPVPQLSFVRQRTNVSSQNTKRRPNRKANPVPPSQMLNQLLIGKENMTGNKVKDVESSYKQLEDLYNETIEKLTCPENENLSFLELFKLLVDLYDASKRQLMNCLAKIKITMRKLQSLNKGYQRMQNFIKKNVGSLKTNLMKKMLRFKGFGVKMRG